MNDTLLNLKNIKELPDYTIVLFFLSVFFLLVGIVSLPKIKRAVYNYFSKFRFFSFQVEIHKKGLQGSSLFILKYSRTRIFFFFCLISFILILIFKDEFNLLTNVIAIISASYLGLFVIVNLCRIFDRGTVSSNSDPEFVKFYSCIMKYKLTSYQKTWEAFNNPKILPEERTILGNFIEKLNMSDEDLRTRIFHNISNQHTIENFYKKLSK